MKAMIYVDPVGGLAGDMLLGALLGAGAHRSCLETLPQRLGFDDVSITLSQVRRGGFQGHHVQIDWEHGAHPRARTLGDIIAIIDKASLDASVKQQAKEVFTTLAEAEARVHGAETESVHFHEVGAVDAICDIVGCCELLSQLGVHELHCGPLPMGRGFVKGAHGSMPLPVPAVAEMLHDVPIYDATIRGETVTPTGLAVVKTLAKGFGPMPTMRVQRVGVGAGRRDDKELANIVRVFRGEQDGELAVGQQGLSSAMELPADSTPSALESLIELQCNLDDMDPRLLPRVVDQALAHGALEAFTTPTVMKKGRPGHLLTVLTETDRVPTLSALIFRETTTFGLRRSVVHRQRLPRENQRVQTPFGEVEVKVAFWDGEPLRCMPEYEPCAALADRHGVPLQEVLSAAQGAWQTKIAAKKER